MAKFSKIEDLYPKDYKNFYESDDHTNDETHSETDIEVPEPKPVQTHHRSKHKKVRFADQYQDTSTMIEPVEVKPVGLKEKITNIFRENLINLVVVLVGFILMSNDYVIHWISDHVTTNPIANMSVRALGAGIIYLVFTVVNTMFTRTSSP